MGENTTHTHTHCMAINVSVQYNGGLLLDIIMLTQFYYHTQGNLFKCHEKVFYLQPMIPPKRFDISPPDWNDLGGANPAVNTPRPGRGTRIESCDFIVLISDPFDSSCLFNFAWPRVSSGSDGLYLYLLCLTCRLRRLTVWSLIFLGGFIFIFQ